jgi:3-dehydroquinate dehydratase-2
MKILVLHGPNLNLLGEREPEVYGSMTLAQLNTKLKQEAKKKKITLKTYQSNHEGDLIDQIHTQRKWADAIVINPGAYTHYSYALRDAISSVSKPTIEVHLSDIHAREDFRKISVISPVCLEQISGLGWKSYLKALERLLERGKKDAR